MGLGRFIVRRLALSLLVLAGLSVLIFLIARVVPGDPARQALGPRAPEWAVENLRKEMNLDKPLHVQYYLWVKGLLQGDLGKSLLTRRPVVDDIKEFLPATCEIVVFSALVMAIGGILLGVLSASYPNSWFDNLVRVVAYLGIVTPSFVWAVVFVLIFGYIWPILPVVGRLEMGVEAPPVFTGFLLLDSLIFGKYEAFVDALRHLILPSVALALGGMAQAARITRSSLMENMGRDYALAQVAYGIPWRVILTKYLLKPSLIPTVSVMALDIAALFANAFLVELVFNYPGISGYGIRAMLNKDLNAITGVIMVLGVIFTAVNIIVDLVVAYLDPRVRLLGGSQGG